MVDLEDIAREIGTVTIASRKGEVRFDYDDADGSLVVIYSEHNPDGSYTDPITWLFSLDD